MGLFSLGVSGILALISIPISAMTSFISGEITAPRLAIPPTRGEPSELLKLAARTQSLLSELVLNIATPSCDTTPFQKSP